MNKNILFAGVLALLSTSTALAQSATDKNIVLLGAQKMSVGYTDTTFFVPVLTNQELEVKSSSDWVTPTIENKRLKIKVATNNVAMDRNATITISSKDGAMARTFKVDQDREGYAAFVPTDEKVKVASATASDSQSGEGIERTYDGDVSTLWHSPYNNNQGGGFPFTLTYNFKNVDHIDYLRYVPRTSGGSNGNFNEVEIYVKCAGDTDYKQVYKGSWGGKSSSRDVSFETPLKNPESIQFKILSGSGNFASCAEMEFYQKKADDPNTAIFASDLCDALKEGVTQDEINALTNPFCKFVAQQLYDNKAEFTKDRIQEYTCRLSPEAQSDLLKAPGKYYDHLQGVTGININKGTHAIAVSGLPDGESLTLKVVAWFPQELNAEGNGGGPVEYSYTLHNGLNSIEYKSDYDGLAYIAYYSDTYPVDHAKYPNVKVHFINGNVNGYLTPDKTNEELDVILKNAKNRCIDLVGSKVHSVWQASGMRNYCKALDGTSKGYVQFMNVLDTLVDWEHHLLGLKKYNRVPDNRTMAYVNYTYYMFQGYYGVSFKYDCESRVLNCKTIMKNDGDAIWGLSHEWGHQHQMQPYFCWAGLGESSNNMNSCENVLRMGYHDDWHAGRIKGAWESAYNSFFVNVNDTATSEPRLRAYNNISRFSWSSAVQDEIRAQYAKYYKNGRWEIPAIAEDAEHGLSTHEVYVEANTAPFYMLHNYFSYVSEDKSKVDYQLDLYESLRQNDNENGSAIETYADGSKKTKVDKYELIASAQNGVKGKLDKLKELYPNTCWLKYINANSNCWQNSVPFIFNYIRKASLISGYNLFDYFDKFGFMRTIIMSIDDYGLKDYAMMEDMKAEFKEDMKALGLKEVSADMMKKMAHSPLPVYETPNIPNEPVKK